MNKAQVVARVARECGISKSEANRALDALIDNITRALKKGDKVTLVGFGTFDTYRRRARPGVNPRTLTPMKIPGRRVPRFTAGKDLRKAIV
ncbi:MAG TPA: HU family DNA-binding protein [Vicinamibacteria bacterium]|nr:HU family DNA-binding protein [Vicinamibacteria bacterium]